MTALTINNYINLSTLVDNFDIIVLISEEWNLHDASIWGIITVVGVIGITVGSDALYKRWLRKRHGREVEKRADNLLKLWGARKEILKEIVKEIKHDRALRGKARIALTALKYERYYYWIYWHMAKINMNVCAPLILIRKNRMLRLIVKVKNYFKK
jgi:hypothetical protein